jgi:hypothetical protein
LFEEANSLDKWKDLYGTIILANLAYICAMKRNYSMARQYLDEYDYLFGA